MILRARARNRGCPRLSASASSGGRSSGAYDMPHDQRSSIPILVSMAAPQCTTYYLAVAVRSAARQRDARKSAAQSIGVVGGAQQPEAHKLCGTVS
jgi:hypothetical protein